MADWKGGVNAASQFLQGYLGKKEQLEEKQKKEKEVKKTEEKINELMQSGWGATWELDSVTGRRVAKFQSPEVVKAKQSETVKFRQDLQNAIRTGDWATIKAKYPEPIKQQHIEEVRRRQLPQAQPNPKFKFGTGGLISQIGSKFSPNQAEISSGTSQMISQIQDVGANAETFKELIQDKQLHEADGVDVDAILEYYGLTEKEIREGQAR